MIYFQSIHLTFKYYNNVNTKNCAWHAQKFQCKHNNTMQLILPFIINTIFFYLHWWPLGIFQWPQPWKLLQQLSLLIQPLIQLAILNFLSHYSIYTSRFVHLVEFYLHSQVAFLQNYHYLGVLQYDTWITWVFIIWLFSILMKQSQFLCRPEPASQPSNGWELMHMIQPEPVLV